MDINDLEDDYPRTRRLLASLPANLIELDGKSTILSLGDLTAAVLRTEQQLLVIRLDTLEVAPGTAASSRSVASGRRARMTSSTASRRAGGISS